MDSELQDSEKCPSNSAKRGGEREIETFGELKDRGRPRRVLRRLE